MIGWLKISALIAIFAAAMGGYALIRNQAETIAGLEASNAALASNLKAAETAMAAETQIQTVTRTVYVKSEKAAAHVQTVDPKCAAGDVLVADFRTQLDGLRHKDATGDTAAP